MGTKRDRCVEIEEYNKLVTDIKSKKDWFKPFMELVYRYYVQEPCGGCMHLVLDDGNLEDHNLHWCAGYSSGVDDMEANDLANLMVYMTMEQRELVYKNVYID